MTGEWKEWKSKRRIPTLPTALGNRPRDFHIPTGPTILLILTKGDQTSFRKVSPMSPG
jgi:hypothetical protein